MLILTVRTDSPMAQIGLFDSETQLELESWEAGRQLAETIHSKANELLMKHRKNWHSIEGIVCFEGPGSFTGLRIGLTVANSLSYGLGTPIVSSKGDNWLEAGISKLLEGQNDIIALPRYGSDPHITNPRK